MTKLLGDKKLNTSMPALLFVVLILALFVHFFYSLRADEELKKYNFQHLNDKDADPEIGPTEIPEGGIIDPETFITHLPLVVIDTNGVEVPNIYKSIDDNQTRGYADPEVTDPYIPVHMYLVNNEKGGNRITDTPGFKNTGKIKMRGNSSRHFEKKQYKIKLLDSKGNELEAPLLGMEADEDWILCNSILDASYIRSYLAMNLGGIVMPFTPEVRFCELVYRNGKSYEYKGLYLLMESIKKGKGRVNIATYKGNPGRLSYIVDRDRYDTTAKMLSTYASDTQLCYGWFDLRYPKNELADEATVHAIEKEISEIEKVLYSDDPDMFKNYVGMINVDSFIDYMVVNEFLMNYDAGEHSTYYYKDRSHRFSAGPIWDYDNCLDNYKNAVAGISWMVFPSHPWYERLTRDPDFNQKVAKRYHTLRKTVFSDRFVKEFVKGTTEYLGHAIDRESSRWGEVYNENHVLKSGEGDDGFIIYRARDRYNEEITRLIDVQQLHAKWLDAHIEDFLSEYEEKNEKKSGNALYSALAVIMIVSFFTSIIYVNRIKNGTIK
ncbi:CotH kinase family protein [Oribacterium sp. C9]|uniref:CotH kinase family protein n=1 Tax=Oribacterium sp. C9 TaxID=1943579 RepID=UPI00098F17D2|nr:CotH kinase family protein [Oribacterium sp. C9]